MGMSKAPLSDVRMYEFDMLKVVCGGENEGIHSLYIAAWHFSHQRVQRRYTTDGDKGRHVQKRPKQSMLKR